MSEIIPVPGSFRDHHGYVFRSNNILYRAIAPSYQEEYRALISSGLYSVLSEQRLLIPHREVENSPISVGSFFKVLQPEEVPFISYPYEWSFSQLRDAALCTLQIQRIAIEHGMTLQDSSAYNIQFVSGRAILIDTLSFLRYRDGTPWSGYKQFCEHFLAPLALMALKDIRLQQLLQVYIDGIPLELTSKLLPKYTYCIPKYLFHIHLHAANQKLFEKKQINIEQFSNSVRKEKLSLLINNLISAVASLRHRKKRSLWLHYSEDVHDHRYKEEKKRIVTSLFKKLHPATVWDAGANTGEFAEIALSTGALVIAMDSNEECVDEIYTKHGSFNNILPLLIDFSNPSPSLGWAHSERSSLAERGPCDVLLALALVHHLAITNNVPFSFIAEYFHKLCSFLIVEFIPKDDPFAAFLLKNRKDIFSEYDVERFEQAFSQWFTLMEKFPLQDSQRIVYCMKSKKVTRV